MSFVPYTFANNTGNIPLSELDANFANVKASVNSAIVVTGSAQPNITSVGTLTSLSVSGNIASGRNIFAAGNISTVGSISANGTLNISQTATLGNAVINGFISVAGNVTGGGGSTFVIQNTANATAATTGALQVYGGASINKDLWVVGNIYAGNIVGTTANVITIEDPLAYFSSPTSTYPYTYDIGFYSAFTGGTSNTYQHTGLARDFNDNTWKLFSNVAEPAGTIIVFDANTVYDSFKSGPITSIGSISATGDVRGANVIAGSNLSVAGNTTLSGTSRAPTVTTGTNDTQIATTAFVGSTVSTAVSNAVLGLGTMSTQNANSVSITGGTLNGVSGTNSGLSVGTATNAGHATTADSATNATNAGHATTADSATNATNASHATTADSATNATNASHATTADSATYATTAGNGGVTSVTVNGSTQTGGVTIRGLGFGGELWNNVTGSRSSGVQYTNSYAYPIMVSVTTNDGFYQHGIDCYVNGVLIANPTGGGNNYHNSENASFIVPPGATYQVNFQTGNTSFSLWAELY